MKFLLTSELGRLAKWLRVLGYDTEYMRENKPASLTIKALSEERVVLTRNHHLPRSMGLKIVEVKAEEIRGQVAEVLKRLDISADMDSMFTRCLLCNKALVGIDKAEVKDRVPEYVFKTQERFISCPDCRRVYWKGTHWGNVAAIIKEIS